MSESSASMGLEIALSTSPLPPQSQRSMKMPPNPQLPQRYHLRSRLKKIKTCPSDPSTPEPVPFAQFLPSQPYQSLGPMQRGGCKSKSKRSSDRLPPPSKGENMNSEPLNSDSEKGMSRHSQISIGSEQRHTSKLTELPLAHRALSQTVLASSTSESRLEDNPPKPTTSTDPPKTLQLLKEPWGGAGDNIYYHKLYAHPYLSIRHEHFAPEGLLPGWIQIVLDVVNP